VPAEIDKGDYRNVDADRADCRILFCAGGSRRKQTDYAGNRDPRCGVAQEPTPVLIDDLGIARRDHFILLGFSGFGGGMSRANHLVAGVILMSIF
jgi:hypothetical protein